MYATQETAALPIRTDQAIGVPPALCVCSVIKAGPAARATSGSFSRTSRHRGRPRRPAVPRMPRGGMSIAEPIRASGQ